MTKTKKKGLASASGKDRKRVASLGGKSPHPHGRGMQKVSKAKRKEIARMGGLARGKSLKKKKKDTKEYD